MKEFFRFKREGQEVLDHLATLESFIRYCDDNRDRLINIDGQCENCGIHKKCRNYNKYTNIMSIIKMNESEARFPGVFLRFVQSYPVVLHAIPAEIYYFLYKNPGWAHLGCPFIAKQVIDNIENIKTAFSLLLNNKSRQVFLNILMFRLTLDLEYVRDAYSNEPQYFITPFRGLGADEVFVDCGAYDGDSFIEYCRHNKPPRQAYLFEPDENNMERMRCNLNNYHKNTDIVFVDKGLSSSEKTLYFFDGRKECSVFSQVGNLHSKQTGVVSIDTFIKEKVSFIKMDIEGYEREALIGAKQHILETYPRLAICIYHHITDLWDIILMIKEMFPLYDKFEVRHHKLSFADTVLYAYK